jgi:hypothetical protein
MSWVYRGIVWCPWKICLTSLGLSFLICRPKQQSYFGIKRSVREKVEGNVSHQTNPPGDYRLGGTEEEAWGEPWLWSQIQKAVSGSAAPWQCRSLAVPPGLASLAFAPCPHLRANLGSCPHHTILPKHRHPNLWYNTGPIFQGDQVGKVMVSEHMES